MRSTTHCLPGRPDPDIHDPATRGSNGGNVSVAVARVAFCCPHVEKPASPVRVRTTGKGNMNKRYSVRPVAGLAGMLLPALLLAHEPEVMQKQVVTGRADPLLGIAAASSEGYVGRDHLDLRPLLRPGEVLETVPGLLATQHSGAGKANQYFLRGFNLDHGTDFATSLDGVPVNLPTHAHGQGYTDLNFLIPELVETVHYRKGPYHADVGDFGSAGTADLSYAKTLDRGLAQLEAGSFGYARGVFAGSGKTGPGNLLYGLELAHDDGPWTNPQDYQKINGVLRYSQEHDGTGYDVTALAYAGRWDSTDQVARRAPIGRYDALDDSDGGESKRFSLAAAWHHETDSGHTEAQVYGVYYDLDLFSNFTYFLADPVRGDQFEQHDRRGFGGLKAHHTWKHELAGHEMEDTIGIQVRGDHIENGLNATERRQLLATTRADTVDEISISPYVQDVTRWGDKLRSTLGARVDHYRFDVRSDNPANSGTKDATLASPKAALVIGPWADTEFYLDGGLGFHSNDGRGATTKVDPATGAATTPVDPLVRTYGAEFGIRTIAVKGLQSTVSVWWLDVDSELLFVGDAGSTEPSRPSRRYGIEFANYYTATKWLTLDVDLSGSRARFRDADPAGREIPGSIETVVAAGVSVHDLPALKGFFASLRLRYFGPRPLIEDDSVRSAGTLMLNAQAGYRFNADWTLAVEIFNLLDRKDSDIDYLYTSRLRGEAIDPADPRFDAASGGYNDIHSHPVEPLSARVVLTARF